VADDDVLIRKRAADNATSHSVTKYELEISSIHSSLLRCVPFELDAGRFH